MEKKNMIGLQMSYTRAMSGLANQSNKQYI